MRSAVLLAFAALSCSAPAPAPAPAPAQDDTGTVAVEDTAIDTEPPEVCGNKVGDVFCNVELMGYARTGETSGLANTTEYGAHKLKDVLAMSTKKYVYVYASAYW
jgi:hypothetical protein